MLIADQNDGPEALLQRIPDALVWLRRVNQLRLVPMPDQHRRQVGIAEIRPDRQKIDIMKADVIDAVAQHLEPDILDETAIEREPEGLLHNGQNGGNVLVKLVAREISRHVRQQLRQMLRAIPIGYDDSQAWQGGRQMRSLGALSWKPGILTWRASHR